MTVGTDGDIAFILDVGVIANVVLTGLGAGEFDRKSFDLAIFSGFPDSLTGGDFGGVSHFGQVSHVPHVQTGDGGSDGDLKGFEAPTLTSGSGVFSGTEVAIAQSLQVNFDL